MFPKLWDWLVAYFARFIVAGFQEGARNAEGLIVQQLEAGVLKLGGTPPAVPGGSSPSPSVTAAPTASVVPVLPVPALPSLTSPSQANDLLSSAEAQPQPVRRPRGRPRKEPPKC